MRGAGGGGSNFGEMSAAPALYLLGKSMSAGENKLKSDGAPQTLPLPFVVPATSELHIVQVNGQTQGGLLMCCSSNAQLAACIRSTRCAYPRMLLSSPAAAVMSPDFS